MSELEGDIVFLYNPWKKIRELKETVDIFITAQDKSKDKISELKNSLTIKTVEVDLLTCQIEELKGTVSVLERWLAEVRQEKDEFKQNLYRLSGIVREQKQQTTPVFDKIPTGKASWRSVQAHLEENRRNISTPITKETIEEVEKEVGINASKVS